MSSSAITAAAKSLQQYIDTNDAAEAQALAQASALKTIRPPQNKKPRACSPRSQTNSKEPISSQSRPDRSVQLSSISQLGSLRF
jgi:hypothetical protein